MLANKHWILIASLLICIANARGQVSGFDKVGSTSFTFLQVIPNARVAAMGGVYTVNIRTSEAVFFNPAGIAHAADWDASLSYMDWFLDVTLSSFSMNYRLGNIGSIGLQAMIVDIGSIEETRVDHLFRDSETGIYNSGITGSTFSPGAYVLGLTFARNVTHRFSFGLTAKYVRENLGLQTASAVIFDGGVIYDTGFRSLMLGAAVRNFGQEIKYNSKGYPLPQTFTIGVSGYLFGLEDGFFTTIPGHQLLVAFDLSQSRDHSQQQHLGFEYGFQNLFFVRGGYKFNHDEEKYTMGFGLNVYRLRVDYAYNDFGDYLDTTHRFTLGFEIK